MYFRSQTFNTLAGGINELSSSCFISLLKSCFCYNTIAGTKEALTGRIGGSL